MMSGGMGAGITPLSQIYAAGLAHGNQSSYLLSTCSSSLLLVIFLRLLVPYLSLKYSTNLNIMDMGLSVAATKEELAKPKIKLDAQQIGTGMLFAFAL